MDRASRRQRRHDHRPVADAARDGLRNLGNGGFWLDARCEAGDPNVQALAEDAAPWLATCDLFVVVDVLVSASDPCDRRFYRGPSAVDADSLATWYVRQGGDRRCLISWRRTGDTIHAGKDRGEILVLASGERHVIDGQPLPLPAPVP